MEKKKSKPKPKNWWEIPRRKTADWGDDIRDFYDKWAAKDAYLTYPTFLMKERK